MVVWEINLRKSISVFGNKFDSRNWYAFSFSLFFWRLRIPNWISGLISRWPLKLTKFPPPFGGVSRFNYTSHVMKRFIILPLNGFENGSNLPANRTEYILLISWDGNSNFSSANRAANSMLWAQCGGGQANSMLWTKCGSGLSGFPPSTALNLRTGKIGFFLILKKFAEIM